MSNLLDTTREWLMTVLVAAIGLGIAALLFASAYAIFSEVP